MEAVKTHEFIPPRAQHYVDQLDQRGLPCEVQTTPRSVTLICQTERVYATAEFRRRGKGRWEHIEGVMRIDGRRCHPADGFDQLESILADPDHWLETASLDQQQRDAQRRFPEIDVPDEAPRVELNDPAVVPGLAEQIAVIRRALGDVPDVDMRLERHERSWVLRVNRLLGQQADDDKRMQMVVVFVPRGASDHWHIAHLILTSVGSSFGLDLGRNLGKAMDALGGEDMSKAHTVFSGSTAAPRTGNDQLRAKRNTVIRT